MAYSRFFDSDVYVFMSVGGWLECCGCWLSDPDDGDGSMSFTAKSTEEMIAHLKRHDELGFYVPENIYDELWTDDEENFGNSRD